MNAELKTPQDGDLKFRCADAGVKTCEWEATASNEDLLIFQVEQHARNRHNLILDEAGKEKVRASVRLIQAPQSSAAPA